MMAGCYTLHLYCDNATPGDGVHEFREFPHEYSDEMGTVCRAKARKAGWVIKKDGTCLCPKCSGKKPGTPGVDLPDGAKRGR